MSDTVIELDQTEEMMLTSEISDEALEAAAGARRETVGNLTLYYCTYFKWCYL